MRSKGRLPNPPGSGEGKGMDTKIYLDAESAEKLRELSYKTRLPMAEITRKIMAEALAHVKLVPATVYDFEIFQSTRPGWGETSPAGVAAPAGPGGSPAGATSGEDSGA